MEKELPLLAWKVEMDIGSCICFATTKAKAQYRAVNSYWDAYGQRRGVWPNARAWRVERYDKSRLKDEPIQKAWCEDYVMDTI